MGAKLSPSLQSVQSKNTWAIFAKHTMCKVMEHLTIAAKSMIKL